MRIREYKVVKTDSATITVRKDEQHYRSKYSVCLFTNNHSVAVRVSCSDRGEAKKELIRLLKLYTNLTISEILRLKL